MKTIIIITLLLYILIREGKIYQARKIKEDRNKRLDLFFTKLQQENDKEAAIKVKESFRAKYGEHDLYFVRMDNMITVFDTLGK